MADNKTDNDLLSYHRNILYDIFTEYGLKYMNETQILDLLLSFSASHIDTEKKAKDLLVRFNDLEGLVSAPVNKLSNEGLSDISICLLKLLPAVTERYYSSINSGLAYSGSTDELKAFFQPLFMGLGHEEIRIICFDRKLNLTENAVISKGNVSSALVDIRSFLDTVVKCGAKYVAVAHNHPNGLFEPSDDDIRLTAELKAILGYLNMELIDHIIIGKNGVFSMRESMYDRIFGK